MAAFFFSTILNSLFSFTLIFYNPLIIYDYNFPLVASFILIYKVSQWGQKGEQKYNSGDKFTAFILSPIDSHLATWLTRHWLKLRYSTLKTEVLSMYKVTELAVRLCLNFENFGEKKKNWRSFFFNIYVRKLYR